LASIISFFFTNEDTEIIDRINASQGSDIAKRIYATRGVLAHIRDFQITHDLLKETMVGDGRIKLLKVFDIVRDYIHELLGTLADGSLQEYFKISDAIVNGFETENGPINKG
jgi:hypothetical protein